ncbi:MAG: DUF805 domain-containing protein [Beijerinckiaceae bacterium]
MRALIPVLGLLFDPRGRANRQALLLAAGVAVALELFTMFGLQAEGAEWLSPINAIKALTIWICSTSVIRRLHDMDYSGWWLPGGLALACMWTAIVGIVSVMLAGAAVLQPENPGFSIVLGIVMLPVLGATLWLHLAPGSPVINRFGAPTRERSKEAQATQVATAL